MNLQVALPYSKACIFQCMFCCTKSHTLFNGKALSPQAFAFELNEHLKENTYDSVIITGENEPLQQEEYVVEILKTIPKEVNIELTLKGYGFRNFATKYTHLLKRINLVNVSVSDDGVIVFAPFYDTQLNIVKTCHQLGIPTRMTYLLTKELSPHVVREAIRLPYIDQITLKMLQGTSDWIINHESSFIAKALMREAKKVIRSDDRFIVFVKDEQEIWIDTDCQESDNYVIFRADGKIYQTWEEKAMQSE